MSTIDSCLAGSFAGDQNLEKIQVGHAIRIHYYLYFQPGVTEANYVNNGTLTQHTTHRLRM